LHHWCVDAGTEAFNFDESEQAVFRGLTGVDAEMGFDGFYDCVAAASAELTWRLDIHEKVFCELQELLD